MAAVRRVWIQDARGPWIELGRALRGSSARPPSLPARCPLPSGHRSPRRRRVKPSAARRRRNGGTCSDRTAPVEPGRSAGCLVLHSPASRQGPRGVATGRPRSERGMVRAARVRRREGRSRAVRETPDSASRGRRSRRPTVGMTEPNPGAEPAGGTTTRSSAGRAGRSVFEGDRCRTCPKAYTPHDVEGAIYERWLAADVFAPDGRGSTADPTLPPFTIIQPPPNITGSLHLGHAQRTAVEDLMIRHARMRGHRALFLPGLDHASIAAQFVLDGILAREGESRGVARSRALPRADARVRRDDARGDARPAAAGRRVGRLGPPALHDGRGLGQGRPGRVRAALPTTASPTGPRRSSTGARAAGPASATSRSSRRRRPARSGPSATTSSTRRRAQPDPDATITVATTRPETILGDTAVAVHPDDERYAGARRPDGPDPVRRARRADHRRRGGRSRRSAPGAVKITPAHDHDDYATGLRHGLPMITILADDATITGTGDAVRRPRPLRGARDAIVADLEARGDLAGAAAARDGHRALPAQRRRRSSRASRPSGSSGPAPLAGARARRDARAGGRGSCPSASRRPGSTG